MRAVLLWIRLFEIKTFFSFLLFQNFHFNVLSVGISADVDEVSFSTIFRYWSVFVSLEFFFNFFPSGIIFIVPQLFLFAFVLPLFLKNIYLFYKRKRAVNSRDKFCFWEINWFCYVSFDVRLKHLLGWSWMHF